MSRLKGNFKYFPWILTVLITAMSAPLNAQVPPTKQAKKQQEPHRYIKIDNRGNTIHDTDKPQQWPCVRDSKTGLLWEIKTRDGGLQDASHNYSWFVPDSNSNGGFAGYRNKGICPMSLCNTQSYIKAINHQKLCNKSNWRLPTREELRSIISYQIKYPGPVVDQRFFPNTLSQFYWSSVPDANNKDSAWGIGFSFGYDYAYFKSDHGYVRLVSGPLN